MQTITKMVGIGYNVDQICLMAGAINNYSLARSRDYKTAVKSSTRVAVLSSNEDKVLKYLYPAGNLLQYFPYFSRDAIGRALGYTGPVPWNKNNPIPPNVFHQPIADTFNCNHSDYLPPSGNQQLNFCQNAATKFASEVINANPKPSYP